jgi:hypothetical protein
MMPSKRDLKLDEYNIGKYAYRELHNFCLQYPYKKQRLAELRSPYRSPRITGLIHGNGAGQPTEDNAERAAVLSRDCEMIEQAAMEASAEDCQYIIKAVTQDMPWYYLRSVYGLRTYERGFRKELHRFYYYLAKKKKII